MKLVIAASIHYLCMCHLMAGGDNKSFQSSQPSLNYKDSFTAKVICGQWQLSTTRSCLSSVYFSEERLFLDEWGGLSNKNGHACTNYCQLWCLKSWQAKEIQGQFSAKVQTGCWRLIPGNMRLLLRWEVTCSGENGLNWCIQGVYGLSGVVYTTWGGMWFASAKGSSDRRRWCLAKLGVGRRNCWAKGEADNGGEGRGREKL